MSGSNQFDLSTHPYCHKGHQYALDVINGIRKESKFVIGTCKRYFSDLEKKEYPFDVEKAERFLRLAQKFKNIKGNWDSEYIIFEPWQCFIFMNLYGFMDPRTGYRRYRVAYLEIARANGKSTICSICSLFELALDDPKGNEISFFATSASQSRIVLDSARAMARENKSYLRSTGAQVTAHTVKHDQSNSVMRSRSSEAGTLDGLNDKLSVIDELHSVKQELYDVVVSGLKKRRDSLLLCITTAGTDLEGVGFSQSQYAKRLCLGEIEDDQTFAAVYTLDPDDDIFDEENWIKANPNYGVSVDPIAMRSTAKKAREIPTELANFKIKNLNIWNSELSAFFNLAKWDACSRPELRAEDFKGQRCRIGVDLASKVDLTTYVKIFKKDDKYYLFDTSYIPEKTVANTPNNSLYINSIGQGFLHTMPGETIDQEVIEKAILADAKLFKIQEAMFDPWNAAGLMSRLKGQRIECVEFHMRVSNLSEPMKTLDALVREGRLFHNGSPLMRWCIGNVVAKYDANDNVFPRKSNEKLKIDLAVAAIMALAGWLVEEKQGSVYEREARGIRFL